MICRTIKALLLIILLGIVACNYSDDKDYKSAVDSTETWLELVDEGRYSDSWKAAASSLKTIINAEQWETALIDYRKILGSVHSRSLRSKENVTSLSGLHDGKYVIIQFKTNFENQSSATEIIKVILEKDGTWRVSGYDLRL